MASPPDEPAQQFHAGLAVYLARYLPSQSEEFLGPVLDLPALLSDSDIAVDDNDWDYSGQMDGADGTYFPTWEEPSDCDRETGDLGGDFILWFFLSCSFRLFHANSIQR